MIYKVCPSFRQLCTHGNGNVSKQSMYHSRKMDFTTEYVPTTSVGLLPHLSRNHFMIYNIIHAFEIKLNPKNALTSIQNSGGLRRNMVCQFHKYRRKTVELKKRFFSA